MRERETERINQIHPRYSRNGNGVRGGDSPRGESILGPNSPSRLRATARRTASQPESSTTFQGTAYARTIVPIAFIASGATAAAAIALTIQWLVGR